jgi:hypothetical protein
MADNSPVEENIFHLRPGPNVVDNQITPGAWRFLIYHDSDVRNSSAQVPRDQVTWLVIPQISGERQGFSMPAEKHHQIRYAAVINVRVGPAGMGTGRRSPLTRVGTSIGQHVFVDFLLQVYTNRSISADHLVGANPGRSRHVPCGVGHTDVGGIVADDVVSTFDGGSHQSEEKLWLLCDKLRRGELPALENARAVGEREQQGNQGC